MKRNFLFAAVWLITFPVQAQNIDIDADERMEWYRDEQKIVAIGNAVAVKGSHTLRGNVLTMFYEKVMLEDGTQKNQIRKILADGSVHLEMPDSNGRGEHFDYDLPLKTAYLSGSPAYLKNQLGELTATDGITYYGAENKSVALGNVVAKNPEYTVYADKMISYFDEDKQGKKRPTAFWIVSLVGNYKLLCDFK